MSARRVEVLVVIRTHFSSSISTDYATAIRLDAANFVRAGA